MEDSVAQQQQPVDKVNPNPFLSILRTINKLDIHQHSDISEIITGIDSANRYSIYNEERELIAKVEEQSVCMDLRWFGFLRAFRMVIANTDSTEVIHLIRPFRCQLSWFSCSLMKMSIEEPVPESDSIKIGEVYQLRSFWEPRFVVQNADGENVFFIRGSRDLFKCCSCRDYNFKVISAIDKSEIGEIRKRWGGLTKELFTKADDFEVTFAEDLELSIKILMFGTVFLIDMMYFELPTIPHCLCRIL